LNEPLIGNIPGTHDWAGRPMNGDRYRANYDDIFRKRDKRDLSTKRMIIDQPHETKTHPCLPRQ